MTCRHVRERNSRKTSFFIASELEGQRSGLANLFVIDRNWYSDRGCGGVAIWQLDLGAGLAFSW